MDCKTIDDFLKVFRKDEELLRLIETSGDLKHEYKPRPRLGMRSQNSRSGIAAKHFWDGMGGIKFRYLLETKYGVNTENYRLISKVKTALNIYFHELIDK